MREAQHNEKVGDERIEKKKTLKLILRGNVSRRAESEAQERHGRWLEGPLAATRTVEDFVKLAGGRIFDKVAGDLDLLLVGDFLVVVVSHGGLSKGRGGRLSEKSKSGSKKI